MSGDPANLNNCRFNQDPDGRLELDVTADWPDNVRPQNAIQHQSSSCTVRLILGGNPPQAIPISGQPVTHAIHYLGTGLTFGQTWSTEF